MAKSNSHQRAIAEGFVTVHVYVPPEHKQELVELAQKYRERYRAGRDKAAEQLLRDEANRQAENGLD